MSQENKASIVLKVLPGKVYFTHALEELGINREGFMDILTAALKEDGKGDKNSAQLRDGLVKALQEHLPSRKTETS